MTLFRRAFANRIRVEATVQLREAEENCLADTFSETLDEGESHDVEPASLSEERDNPYIDTTDPVFKTAVDADLIRFNGQTKDDSNVSPVISEDTEDMSELNAALPDGIETEQPEGHVEDPAEQVQALEHYIDSVSADDDDQNTLSEALVLDAPATERKNPSDTEAIAEVCFATPPAPTVRALAIAEAPFDSDTHPVNDEIAYDPTLPKPIEGRSGRRAGRVKTRMLGFSQDHEAEDIFAVASSKRNATTLRKFPVGWCVVAKGPGQGHAFPLYNGVSSIGRSEDQAIPLSFGDNSISRENHAAIAYDNEQNGFFLGQSGKSNIIRLNEHPVLSTESLRSGDQIRIGETTLRFVALCCEEFRWDDGDVGV
jgi:hypothetical protein